MLRKATPIGFTGSLDSTMASLRIRLQSQALLVLPQSLQPGFLPTLGVITLKLNFVKFGHCTIVLLRQFLLYSLLNSHSHLPI